MSVYLEMQIDEMADEMTALKALNQKLQLEKNVLKEQLNLGVVSQQRELLIKCLIEWECSDDTEDIRAYNDWLNERPHLINCG